MEIPQSYLLILTLTLGYEYGLKQWWWGSIGAKITKPAYNYVLYRLLHLILLSGSGPLLFSDVPLVDWLIISTCFVLLGSLELVLRQISLRVQRVTGASFYQLNYLVPLALVLFGRLVDYAPRLDFDYRLVFLFVFSAHPANYFIRWALNKDKPVLGNQIADDKLIYASEAAATTTHAPWDLELDDQRAKVGRRIGTVERWLIVLLIASKNVSSLGLVITAKSIVRYPQLSDKEFAEYYLFGTLLSVVLALVSGFLVLGGL